MIDWDANVLQPLMGVFGEPITYQPAAFRSRPFTITGVFDDGYMALVLLDDGGPANASFNPVLGIRLAEFPSPPKQSDRLTVQSTGNSYVVNLVKPDGKGGAKLELNLSE